MNFPEGGPSQTPEQPKSSNFPSEEELDVRSVPPRVEFPLVPEGFWGEYDLSVQSKQKPDTKKSLTGDPMLDLLAHGAIAAYGLYEYLHDDEDRENENDESDG